MSTDTNSLDDNQKDNKDTVIPNDSVILQFCTNLKEINQQNEVIFL